MTTACKSLTRILVSLLIVGAISFPSRAKADPAREFIMSCSYGVLAGTLVGAASLAFSDKPGENLHKVARGASIGLYAGILLGLYVVYGAPNGEDDGAVVSFDSGVEESRFARADVKRFEPSRLLIFPVVGERGLEGASAQYSLLNF